MLADAPFQWNEFTVENLDFVFSELKLGLVFAVADRSVFNGSEDGGRNIVIAHLQMCPVSIRDGGELNLL